MPNPTEVTAYPITVVIGRKARLHDSGSGDGLDRLRRCDGAALREFGDGVDAAGEIELHRGMCRGLDLIGDGTDLNHQHRGQHDHADRVIGVLRGDPLQSGGDQQGGLLHLDQGYSDLPQHGRNVGVVIGARFL